MNDQETSADFPPLLRKGGVLRQGWCQKIPPAPLCQRGNSTGKEVTMIWYARVLVILGIVLGLGSASQAQAPAPQSQPPPTEVTQPETKLAVFDEVWQSV